MIYIPDVVLYYEKISQQVEREDGLINNRLSWFLTSEGLLFAAFAVAVGADSQKWNQEMLLIILLALSILGYTISFYALQSVRAAERALVSLRKAWEKYVDQYYHDRKHVHHTYLPRPYGDDIAWKGGHSFNKALPLSTGITWVMTLLALAFFVLTRTLFPNSDVGECAFWLARIVLVLLSLTGLACLIRAACKDFREPEIEIVTAGDT